MQRGHTKFHFGMPSFIFKNLSSYLLYFDRKNITLQYSVLQVRILF